MKPFAICIFLIYSFLNQYSCTKCSTIFLTVNAVTNFIEYNWDFTINCTDPPDSLSLLSDNQIVEEINVTKTLNGTRSSGVRFGKPEYPGGWSVNNSNPSLNSSCYPFQIQSKRGSEVVDTNCMKIEPTWMQNFGKLDLGKMMIPGTHDSGAFNFSGMIIFKNYIVAQDYDLWGQLVTGIRYFDIRVGVYDKEVWINHGDFKCTKMKPELENLSKFLRVSPKEVVLLHMKRFEMPPRFTKEHHQLVLNLIQTVLGDHILSAKNFTNKELILDEIWKNNRRLIVSYGDDEIVRENPWLWHDILHKWGNKIELSELHDYLNAVKSNHNHPSTPFCSLMAQLTPTGDYIFNHLHESLRNLADEVNPNLNSWLRNDKWSDVVNIVSTDFFLGSDVVSISMEANTRRLLSITNN